MELKLTCLNPDMFDATAESVKALVEEQVKDNDILIFPEYFLEVIKVPLISYPGKLIIYGSKIIEGQNRLIGFNGAEKFTVAKQKLTPWESNLIPGKEISILNFKGLKIAVLICFDIEFPELAVSLKKENIDILIVPSATETLMGYERVSRCASARAVELGCAVVTCHLIGKTPIEMVDINIGEHNLFLPSQSKFNDLDKRGNISNAKEHGEVFKSYIINTELLRSQKEDESETNPSILY